MTSRSYCFTLNNYTNTHLAILYNRYCKSRDEDGKIRYICYGREIGEQGTPHLQGYLELNEPMRMSGCKDLFGINGLHLEKRMGTRDQARDYTKKDTKWIEFGNWRAGGQGRRMDIITTMEDIKEAVKENKKTIEMVEKHPVIWAANLKFCEKVQGLYEAEVTKEFRKVDVEVLWGSAGIGKTKTVHEYDPDVFTANCDDSFIFDGYDGQKTILLDDFKGQVKYKNLLRILDGYQYRCNVKGGHRYARWTKVFITANDPPSDWYSYGLTPALRRRLTVVKALLNPDDIHNLN